MENLLGDGADWEERLAFIVDVMRDMSRHVDPHEMVAAYTRRMRAVNADRTLSLSRRGVEPPQFVLARDTDWEHQPNPWQERDKLPRLEGGLLGELIFGDAVRLIPSLEVAPDDPNRELLEGYGSLLAVPVFDGGEGRNVVVFLRRDREAFEPASIPRVVWTTNLMGRATHNLVTSRDLEHANKLLDSELRMVGEVQRSLLPQELPSIPSLGLAVSYRPAKFAGGDYYDVLPLGDGRWCILIADVSGHGSPAAVGMAITRTLVRVYAETGSSPGELLAFVNQRFNERIPDSPNAFVTGFCAVWDESNWTMTYASAGHHPPRVKRCGDSTYFGLDEVGGPPLGVLEDIVYEEARIDLAPGDQILFFTDGLPEAFGPNQELFGAERLDQTIANCGEDPQALIDTVEAELFAFTQGRELADDITLLVAKVGG